MLETFQTETGSAPSGTSDLAVRLYAVAAQVHALYIQGEWVARQCFPQTAEGEYLDLHAALRGVERREAARAQGLIAFAVSGTTQTALTIPAGTVCLTAGLVRFETLEEGTIQIGETQVLIPAQAVEPGEGGNVAAGTIRSMAVAPVGVNTCHNPQAFTGGSDEEDDESLRARVLETYRRLPNGANAAYYQQEAMSFEEVAAASVLSRARGVGTVDVVVSTAQGLPGEELLEELRAHFEARREIAVDVQVRAPEARAVDVNVAVSPAEGYSAEEAKAAARTAVESWFDGKRLGQSVLRAELSSRIFATDAVANCMLTAPAEDVVLDADELPRLGQVTVTDLEVGA